jgi:hypothetical protein
MISSKCILKELGRPAIGAGLLALLAACGTSVPLTPVSETHPAPGAPAIGSGALWTRQLVIGNFNCELNNKVGVQMGDGQRHINLTWKGRSYVLLPIATTTGALRFEDRSSGLVWIQIPAKSMLLNAKLGQQLANDCKI